MTMDNINKTLYIPLRGKAFVSRKGIILNDPKAEEIWAAEGFPLKGKSRSRWLAYYMGMRSAVFDRWLRQQMEADPEAVVVHPGCGLDSRIARVGTQNHIWFDIDFPDVIAQRGRHYDASGSYNMLGSDIRSVNWSDVAAGGNAIVVMEGVSMYLSPDELIRTLSRICGHFEKVRILMDCYSEFAARASRYKNPINDVGVTQVYGIDDPKLLEKAGMRFVREHDMTPPELTDTLTGIEKKIFKTLFAGSVAAKMYRLYEFRK